MRSTSRTSSGLLPLADAQSTFRHLTAIDWGLLVSGLLLGLIGLATVNSASAELSADYLSRQAVWLSLGVFALVLALAVDYHKLLHAAPYFYGLGLVLLLLVFLVGREAGGAQSRLGVGALSIQPSEFAKLATALLLSRFFAGLKKPRLHLKDIFMALLITGVPVTMVALEPDLGSAAMFCPILGGMLFVAGVRGRTIVVAVLLGLVLGAGVWTFGMHDYQRQRVVTFLQPESDPLGAGYQVRQSKIAVGSGGLTGQGYMQGTQSQLRFLPARHTDFIFAVLAEEWGFTGVVVVEGLYALYLLSAAGIALRARNRAGIFLVTGLVSLLAFHILYNTAMVVGLVPITGIPLPFLSYGGSFTLMCCIATGLILNVDLRRYVNR
ncbi:MAG: rod shape-determining protein RodA [Acidobacteriota bacterium]|nr:rod shape-determining protein RodA [Acidobacteriota bacterium]